MKEQIEKILTQFNESEDSNVDLAKDAITKLVESAVQVELTKKEEKLIEQLNQESEDKIQESIKEHTKKITENTDSYIEATLSAHLEKMKPNIAEDLKIKKAEAIIEAFDAMARQFFVDTSDETISENEKQNEELSNLQEKLNDLMSKHMKLEQQLRETLKENCIFKVSKDCSPVILEQFEKTAKNMDFNNPEKFTESLEGIAKMLSISVQEVKEKQQQIGESDTNDDVSTLIDPEKNEASLNESTQQKTSNIKKNDKPFYEYV